MGHLLKQEAALHDLGLPYKEQFVSSVLASAKHSQAVVRAHQQYIDAGCSVITTNNFTATPYHFQRAGLRCSAAAITQVLPPNRARQETGAAAKCTIAIARVTSYDDRHATQPGSGAVCDNSSRGKGRGRREDCGLRAPSRRKVLFLAHTAATCGGPVPGCSRMPAPDMPVCCNVVLYKCVWCAPRTDAAARTPRASASLVVLQLLIQQPSQ